MVVSRDEDTPNLCQVLGGAESGGAAITPNETGGIFRAEGLSPGTHEDQFMSGSPDGIPLSCIGCPDAEATVGERCDI